MSLRDPHSSVSLRSPTPPSAFHAGAGGLNPGPQAWVGFALLIVLSPSSMFVFVLLVCAHTCACVCTCMGICMCLCESVYAHVYRPEVDFRRQALWLSTLFFETESITKLGAHHFGKLVGK